jgi:hypothetical protein
VSDPKVKSLSEEFPLCHKYQLDLNYDFRFGAIVSAGKVEKLLKEKHEKELDQAFERDLCD